MPPLDEASHSISTAQMDNLQGGWVGVSAQGTVMCFVLRFHITRRVEAHAPIGWGIEWHLQGTDGELNITGRAASGKFAPLLFKL